MAETTPAGTGNKMIPIGLPAKQLAQHVIHLLAILLALLLIPLCLGGAAVRLLGLRRLLALGRWNRRDRPVPALPLLDQITQCLAALPAEWLVLPGRAGPARAAENVVQAVIWPEEALAYLAELGVGGVRIVEHPGHIGIDPRLRPWSLGRHGDAEADGAGGAALALRRHHELGLNAEADLLGRQVDRAGAGHLDQRTDQVEIGGGGLAAVDAEGGRQLADVGQL